MMNDFPIEEAYNVLYRNFPGWFYNPDDTVKKAAKAKEAKKPVIMAVENAGVSSKERKMEDSYDKVGSEIRNQLRGQFYTKYGTKN